MQVNILEAKNQLSKLVKAATAGEDVVIASNGTPLVRLVPITNPRGLLAWGQLRKYQASIDAAFLSDVENEVERLMTGRR
jgi:prevent-host-death family protein